MRELLNELTFSPLFGLILCLGSFRLGAFIQKKLHLSALNPLLFAILFCSVFLTVTHIPLERFFIGGDTLTMLLPPATAVLALYIYRQMKRLRQYAVPVLVGCTVGSLVSMASVTLLCHLLGLDRALAASLLPKSCTTPIAMSITESLGGIAPIAVISVIITGICGAVLAPYMAKWFHVEDPMVEGLAIGACSHAVGTSTAVEMGEIQGAMSGVAIGVCGLIQVLLAAVFRLLLPL